MIAALALLASAQGADLYLAGGWSAAPSDVLEIAAGQPSWRVGVSGSRATVWVSGRYGRFSLPDEDVSGHAWQPQLGFRLELAEQEPRGVVGTFGASVFTVGGGLDLAEGQREPNIEVRPVLGGTVGFGLDAAIHERLSVSPELGVQAFRFSMVESDAYVTAYQELTTYAAVVVNLWL